MVRLWPYFEGRISWDCEGSQGCLRCGASGSSETLLLTPHIPPVSRSPQTLLLETSQIHSLIRSSRFPGPSALTWLLLQPLVWSAPSLPAVFP